MDVPEHATFRLCVVVYKCLHDMAPPYLYELCRQTRNIEGRAVNCAQRLAVISTSQDVDYLHTADGPSPALAQQHGTLYLVV